MKKYLVILTLVSGTVQADPITDAVIGVCEANSKAVMYSLYETDLSLRETYRDFLMNSGGICETRIYNNMTKIAKGMTDFPEDKVRQEMTRQCIKPLYLCTVGSRFASQATSEMYVP